MLVVDGYKFELMCSIYNNIGNNIYNHGLENTVDLIIVWAHLIKHYFSQ